MKLLSLLIFHVEEVNGESVAYLLSRHVDLSSFNFFIRGAINEHILFHSRLICSRMECDQRNSVQFERNLGTCHAYRHKSGLAGAVLSDPEYPPRVAFVLLNTALTNFMNVCPPKNWINQDQDNQSLFSQGNELLKKFQNPNDADELCKINKELQEVQKVLVTTIDKLLQRGENLDVLMSRTTDLSAASERFYKQAKKQNQCCKWY